MAGRDATGGARGARAADRARPAPHHAATFPGCSARTSRDGLDGNEHGGQHARTGQRRDAARFAGDARSEDAQPANGRRDKRNVHISGDQHKFCAINSRDRHRNFGRVGIDATDGNCRDRAARDFVRGDGRDRFGQTPGEIADLSDFAVHRERERPAKLRESGS